MSENPDYVHQTLARAQDEGQWQAGKTFQNDILSHCPDIEFSKTAAIKGFTAGKGKSDRAPNHIG